MRILNTTILALALALLAACSSNEELVPAEGGAVLLTYEELSINGKTLKGMIADNFADRVRAETAVALSEEDGQFACLIYGPSGSQGEIPLSLAMDFKKSGELVYINDAGNAVKVYSEGQSEALPPSSEYSSIPIFYPSEKPASIALFLQMGSVAKLGIKEGSKVSLGGDVMSKIASADPSGIKLYFLPDRPSNPEREAMKDPIALITRAATSPEARAKGIADGENALLYMWADNDKTLVQDGFWLKGIEGTYSLAFLRLQSAARYAQPGVATATNGFVIDVIENISDEGDNDLTRKRWWPSEDHVSRTLARTQFTAQGSVNAVLLMRGKDALSTLKIEENMACTGTSMLLPVNQAANSETNGLKGTVVKHDGKALLPTLVRSNISRGDLVTLPYMKKMTENEVRVLAFDNQAKASIANPNGRKYPVALLSHEGGNAFKVAKVLEIEGGAVKTDIDAPSRFALFGPQTFTQGQSIEMPWQTLSIRPSLMPSAFFKSVKAPSDFKTSSPEGSVMLNLEVVDTDEAIATGLGFRKSLPTNQGMLFAFDGAEEHEFWMKNCLMDIDVAFIDEDMKILVIHEMKQEPGVSDIDLKLYSSKPASGGRGKAIFAVEMEGGWFKKNDVSAGDYFWLPSGHGPNAQK